MAGTTIALARYNRRLTDETKALATKTAEQPLGGRVFRTLVPGEVTHADPGWPAAAPFHFAPAEVSGSEPSTLWSIDALSGGVPNLTVLGNGPTSNLVAYCVDLLGNRLRFNLRIAGPPSVWERGAEEEPTWKEAWLPPPPG